MKTTGRQWAGRTAVVGTVFIALGAFWLSFTALADLAARSGVSTLPSATTGTVTAASTVFRN